MPERKTKRPDPIQDIFLDLFKRLDPTLIQEPYAKRFARECARFTRVWAKNHRDNPALVDRAEARLHRWIVKNV